MNIRDTEEFKSGFFKIVTCPICGEETLNMYWICKNCFWEYDVFAPTMTIQIPTVQPCVITEKHSLNEKTVVIQKKTLDNFFRGGGKIKIDFIAYMMYNKKEMIFMDLTKIATCDLVEELSKREGVEKSFVAPYEEYSVRIGEKVQSETGPVVIMVICD